MKFFILRPCGKLRSGYTCGKRLVARLDATFNANGGVLTQSGAPADRNRCTSVVGATVSRAVPAAERWAVGRHEARVRIEFTITTEAGSDLVAIEVPPSDEEILRNFLGEYDRLIASAPLQKDIPCGLTFNFTPETGLALTPNIPSADDLAILLHRLRPFLLQQEPYSFQKTSAVLGRRLDHPGFRALLAYMHRLWKCEGANAQMPVMLNNQDINTEDVLIQWLNSTEYHRDPVKGAAIERLRTQVPPELFDFVIVGLTLEKLRAVIACAKLASVMVGHLRELTFESYRFIRVSPNSALQPTPTRAT